MSKNPQDVTDDEYAPSKFFKEEKEYNKHKYYNHPAENAEQEALEQDQWKRKWVLGTNWEEVERWKRENDLAHIEQEADDIVTYKKGDSEFFNSNHRSSLPNFFIDERVRCAPAGKMGNGCFALEDIPANTLIESAPVILVHQDILKEIVAIHGHTVLSDYPFGWGRDGLMAISMGYGGIYNHKAYPNLTWRPNYEVTSLEYRTTRDIEKGEQLFVRYLPLYKMHALWFEDEESENVAERYYVGKEDPGTMSSWKAFKPGFGKTGR